MEKDKWVNETINSLEGLQPAVPPAALYAKTMQRIAAEKFNAMRDTVSLQTIYRIAAAIAVIISLNAYSCVVFSKSQQEKKTVEAFAREYSLTSSSGDLLNL
jgi:hypothetical protein